MIHDRSTYSPEFSSRRRLEALFDLMPSDDPAFDVMVAFVERRLVELSTFTTHKNGTVRQPTTRAA